MELVDFDECQRLKGRGYHGNTGRKLAYLHDGSIWMVKFPGSSPSKANIPLNEYIGSHIYDALGIPAQDTVLGKCQGKVVVGCRDLTDVGTLLEYSKIKNMMDDSLIMGNYGSSSKGERLGDALRVIEASEELIGIRDEVRCRFWDMFVVDAFICNNKRANGDWGLLVKDGVPIPAPVFGNGNAFAADESFFLDDNGEKLDPIAFMKEDDNLDLKRAVERFASRIDMGKICDLIAEIPESIRGLPVINEEQRSIYMDMINKQERRIRT